MSLKTSEYYQGTYGIRGTKIQKKRESKKGDPQILHFYLWGIYGA